MIGTYVYVLSVHTICMRVVVEGLSSGAALLEGERRDGQCRGALHGGVPADEAAGVHEDAAGHARHGVQLGAAQAAPRRRQRAAVLEAAGRHAHALDAPVALLVLPCARSGRLEWNGLVVVSTLALQCRVSGVSCRDVTLLTT